ncbi:TRAF-interacting protein with FHA domain-containing protein A [Tiliqua scincoides]|uniref:TRAF-interacting protein with FHA domain-containing protein A n=1 Tax=Tiliqua scincoides TaxID=71010 RepID=UPI00346378EB
MTTLEEAAETEEDSTCLYVTVYHPSQAANKIFSELSFKHRYKLKAHHQVMFGRDCSICDFNLVDNRASRIQFALQFFRHFGSLEYGFEIKNLSKKTKLTVNNVELAYLNKADLPGNCTVCFGDYQILLQKQGRPSEDYFEIQFELAKASLLEEKSLGSHLPVPEHGLACTESPVEIDENEWGRSQKR